MNVEDFTKLGGWIFGTLSTSAIGLFTLIKWSDGRKEKAYRELRDQAKELMEAYRVERDAANKAMQDERIAADKKMSDMESAFRVEIRACREECNQHMEALSRMRAELASYQAREDYITGRLNELERRFSSE